MSVMETRLCRDCGASFDITSDEAARFVEKGLTLPLRCRLCRWIRRMEREGTPFTVGRCKTCGGRTVVPFEVPPGRVIYCSQHWRGGLSGGVR